MRHTKCASWRRGPFSCSIPQFAPLRAWARGIKQCIDTESIHLLLGFIYVYSFQYTSTCMFASLGSIKRISHPFMEVLWRSCLSGGGSTQPLAKSPAVTVLKFGTSTSLKCMILFLFLPFPLPFFTSEVFSVFLTFTF